MKVDKNKCIGCGACVAVCSACFEMGEGKAKVINQKCDCLEKAKGVCPVDAIS